MTEHVRPAELTLGVVVPATDAAPFLQRCLASIAEADDGPDEVIVIDHPEMSVVEARNAGASRASSDVLVFIDSDVLVHADAFTRIRAAFATDPRLDGVIGSYDDRPEAPGAVSGFRNLLHHHICASAAGPVATFWTGLGAVHRDVFEAAGGFDDALRWPPRSQDRRDFMADVAFGDKLVDAERRIVLDPQLQGTHLKHWTLPQMIHTDFLLRGVPWVRLLLRRGRAPGHLNLGWRHRISALVSLLGATALARRRAGRAGTMAMVLVALNHRFYALLLRRRGPREAAAGVLVHMIHHLTSLASVLTGLAIHVVERPQVPAVATDAPTVDAVPLNGDGSSPQRALLG
jgi:hypothetical protein